MPMMSRSVSCLLLVALALLGGLQAAHASTLSWTSPADSSVLVVGGPAVSLFWTLPCNPSCFPAGATSNFAVKIVLSNGPVLDTVYQNSYYTPPGGTQQGVAAYTLPATTYAGPAQVIAYVNGAVFGPTLIVFIQQQQQQPVPAPVAVAGFPNIQYMGCWVDNINNPDNRVLPHNPSIFDGSSNPISWCSAKAASSGDEYFGLQYGNQCWTGSDYHLYTAPNNGSLASSACNIKCPSPYNSIMCGASVINSVYRIVPPCSLNATLSSLPPNTLSGSCSSSLGLGSTCAVSCVSPYQVAFGAPYACSSSGVLTGGQACADPVCTLTSAGNETIVPVLGGTYTGPTSAALGSVIVASASMPFPGLLSVADAQGVLSFDGADGSSCVANTAVAGAASSGRCFFAVPGAGSAYTLTSTFTYQRDWCIKYVGVVSSSIALVDLAAVQAIAAAARDSTAAETVRAAAAESRLNQSLGAEAAARASGDAALAAALASETAGRVAGDATLTVAVSAEGARAAAAESALRSNVSALSARVRALETAESSFIFRGLDTGVSVSYPARQMPGSGAANMLNQRIVFDTPLSSRGSTISYSADGVVAITEPGTYRLDAFVHLYSSTVLSSGVGTGVVAWMSVGAAPQPLGPNILNPSAAGVPQGTVGDDTFVSTIVNVAAGASAAAPFTAQCVLVSMNQRSNVITDASVISVTKIR